MIFQNLEERLEKRKKLVESYSVGREVKQKEIEHRVQGHDENMKDLVEKGSLQDRQREEILEKYQLDLRRLQMKNEEGESRAWHIQVFYLPDLQNLTLLKKDYIEFTRKSAFQIGNFTLPGPSFWALL